jgi:hypothetical protein
MSDSRDDNAFDPRLPAACRAVLQAALDAGGAPADHPHLLGCAQCAQRVAAHRRLASWVKSRPVPPQQLVAPGLLAGIHERVIETCESTPLGGLVGKAMAVPPAAAGWPEDLLTSPLAEEAVSAPLVPPAPPAVVWARVRQTILAEVRATPTRRWRVHLWLGAAGVAATLIVSALLREGTRSPTDIVFTDFEAKPDVEIAVWRSGDLHDSR